MIDPETEEMYEIGKQVHQVRFDFKFNAFCDPSMKQKLDDLGFVWRTKDVRYEVFLKEALAFKGSRKQKKLAKLCEGIDTVYNERPYDERGWCVPPGLTAI